MGNFLPNYPELAVEKASGKAVETVENGHKWHKSGTEKAAERLQMM